MRGKPQRAQPNAGRDEAVENFLFLFIKENQELSSKRGNFPQPTRQFHATEPSGRFLVEIQTQDFHHDARIP